MPSQKACLVEPFTREKRLETHKHFGLIEAAFFPPCLLPLLGPAQKVPMGSWKQEAKNKTTRPIPSGNCKNGKKKEGKTHCFQRYVLASSFPSPFKAIRPQGLPVQRDKSISSHCHGFSCPASRNPGGWARRQKEP